MKEITKKVYYCDHCKKRSLSAGHMRTHEKHCTANINRICRLCGRESISELIENFKKRFWLVENPLPPNYQQNGIYESHFVEWTGEPVTMDEIERECDWCPNCTLSVLRQTGMSYHYFKFEWDYKKELEDYWAEKRKNELFESNYYEHL